MSYQEQLAYLRQKREQVARESAPASPTSPQDAMWQEVDEEAVRAVEERTQKDNWLMDAGENVNTATSMDPSRFGKDEEELFKKEFDADPLTVKYGKKMEMLLQELHTQIQDPNSPINAEQAVKIFEDTMTRMVNGEFDDDE